MPKAAEPLRFLQQQGYRKLRQTGSHLILEHPERPMLVVPTHRGIYKDAGFTLSEFRRK